MPQRLPNRRYGWIHRDSTFSVVFMRCFYMRCFKFCPSQWRWTHTYWQGHPDELSILKRWWSSTMDSSTSWQYDDNIWWQYNTIYDHIWLRWWSYCPSRTMWLGRTGFVFFFGSFHWKLFSHRNGSKNCPSPCNESLLLGIWGWTSCKFLGDSLQGSHGPFSSMIYRGIQRL